MTAPTDPSRGRFEGPLHLNAVRVYHEDTDASGVVYHATYLRWFERSRSDILALLDIDQWSAIAADEGYYVVSELAVRYHAPARLGEAVAIVTRGIEAGAASLRMIQTALRGDQKLCEANVRVGHVGPDGRPRRQPEAWRRAFAAIVTPTEGKP